MHVCVHNLPFIGGLLIGLILALPTGPGAFMVMKQGIGKPMLVVLKTAFACIMVDFFWNIALCAFDDTSLLLVSVITENSDLIRAGAGPLLIGVGLYALRSMFLASDPGSGVGKTFAVALLNPLIPVTLIALITYIIGEEYFLGSWYEQIQVVLGIFAGELFMWFVGIRLFHALLLRGFPEIGVPLFFVCLFISSGVYLSIRALLN